MLTTLIDTWLATRRASGFALSKYERHLHRFAAFAAARGEDHIHTATALAWALQAATPGQRRRHFQRVVQLARYLHTEDARHEIPPDGHFPGQRHRPVPYIYTPDEARRLVEIAARLGPAGSMRPRTMSTVLALLFATGLRISEALALRTADVTPDGLVIRETKFGKTRLVPLHPSAQDGLEQYLHCRRAMASGDAHVFVSLGGTRLSYGGFRKAWLVVLGQACHRSREAASRACTTSGTLSPRVRSKALPIGAIESPGTCSRFRPTSATAASPTPTGTSRPRRPSCRRLPTPVSATSKEDVHDPDRAAHHRVSS